MHACFCQYNATKYKLDLIQQIKFRRNVSRLCCTREINKIPHLALVLIHDTIFSLIGNERLRCIYKLCSMQLNLSLRIVIIYHRHKSKLYFQPKTRLPSHLRRIQFALSKIYFFFPYIYLYIYINFSYLSLTCVMELDQRQKTSCLVRGDERIMSLLSTYAITCT